MGTDCLLLLRVRGAARQQSVDGESVKPSRSAPSVPGKRLRENCRVWPNSCAAAGLSQRNAKHRLKKKKKDEKLNISVAWEGGYSEQSICTEVFKRTLFFCLHCK